MAKILMVDDDNDFLEASQAVLTSKGHEVVTVNNVTEGEAKAESENPDIIFLDVMMDQPDDGIALAQRLSKKDIKAPIVMLSGISKVTGYQYGSDTEVLPCNDFLEKPVTPEKLIEKVESLLKA